jgi:hypothetical protein
VGSSSEGQGGFEGDQTQTEASDGRVQMRTDHLGVRKCQHAVFPGGCVPGATDGSMPVGSGLTFSNHLFGHPLLKPPLACELSRNQPSMHFSFIILEQIDQVASTGVSCGKGEKARPLKSCNLL